MREARRLHEPGQAPPAPMEDTLDVDRLLNDPQYMPTSSSSDFHEQRRRHEQADRPWHVSHGQLMYNEEEVETGVYAVTLEMPANEKEWRELLKDPFKIHGEIGAEGS